MKVLGEENDGLIARNQKKKNTLNILVRKVGGA